MILNGIQGIQADEYIEVLDMLENSLSGSLLTELSLVLAYQDGTKWIVSP